MEKLQLQIFQQTGFAQQNYYLQDNIMALLLFTNERRRCSSKMVFEVIVLNVRGQKEQNTETRRNLSGKKSQLWSSQPTLYIKIDILERRKLSDIKKFQIFFRKTKISWIVRFWSRRTKTLEKRKTFAKKQSKRLQKASILQLNLARGAMRLRHFPETGGKTDLLII